MTKDVIALTLDKNVEDAAELMLEKNISVLPVLNSGGHLVGIITESDFIGKEARIPHALMAVKRVLGQIYYDSGIEELYKRVKDLPVDKVMTHHPVTVTPEHTLSDVVTIMNSRKLKRIPVVENNRLVGMVTRHDVVRAFTLLSPSISGLDSRA